MISGESCQFNFYTRLNRIVHEPNVADGSFHFLKYRDKYRVKGFACSHQDRDRPRCRSLHAKIKQPVCDCALETGWRQKASVAPSSQITGNAARSFQSLPLCCTHS